MIFINQKVKIRAWDLSTLLDLEIPLRLVQFSSQNSLMAPSYGCWKGHHIFQISLISKKLNQKVKIRAWDLSNLLDLAIPLRLVQFSFQNSLMAPSYGRWKHHYHHHYQSIQIITISAIGQSGQLDQSGQPGQMANRAIGPIKSIGAMIARLPSTNQN